MKWFSLIFMLVWVGALFYGDVSGFFEKRFNIYRRNKIDRTQKNIEYIRKNGRYLGDDEEFDYYLFHKKLVKIGTKTNQVKVVKKEEYYKVPIGVINTLFS